MRRDFRKKLFSRYGNYFRKMLRFPSHIMAIRDLGASATSPTSSCRDLQAPRPLFDALSGGALRDAAATAAHRISPGNIRRLEISASEPFPAQDAPRDNSPPPPTVPVIIYTEDNPPKREEKRSVTKSGNSPPHPWLWWTLLFLLLFAGYVRHELIAAKEMRLVRQSLARIESAFSRQETATVVECPTPPDVYLSCPASRPEPAERRTRLYRSNPDNSN